MRGKVIYEAFGFQCTRWGNHRLYVYDGNRCLGGFENGFTKNTPEHEVKGAALNVLSRVAGKGVVGGVKTFYIKSVWDCLDPLEAIRIIPTEATLTARDHEEFKFLFTDEYTNNTWIVFHDGQVQRRHYSTAGYHQLLQALRKKQMTRKEWLDNASSKFINPDLIDKRTIKWNEKFQCFTARHKTISCPNDPKKKLLVYSTS